ncbi:MAG: zinc ribbon domain-containing protein [Alphaproteobacteria bacterium]|nr:zinc ribbon domain-containing protein [Alphaproteobacteria bacterium]
MSLKKCPDCGTEVSTKALTCPKCGRRLRKPKRSLFGKLVALVFWLFEIVILSLMFFGVGFGNFLISVFLWFVGTVVLGLLMLFTRPSA